MVNPDDTAGADQDRAADRPLRLLAGAASTGPQCDLGFLGVLTVSGFGRIVRGHLAGTAQEVQDVQDVQDIMAFSVQHGIRPLTEIVSPDQTAEAYQGMTSGAAPFRMVLTPADAARAD
ncbi:hypothetical protein [Streptomyces sp. NBC_01142]|uniref:hypothetical protein n=1 Tax=Streptomyces sp. NBC_01142 TaxID=2975865 RepID=UPI002B1DC267|nr:hypothetical protein [Streptomyces sp. NBC_01142]